MNLCKAQAKENGRGDARTIPTMSPRCSNKLRTRQDWKREIINISRKLTTWDREEKNTRPQKTANTPLNLHQSEKTKKKFNAGEIKTHRARRGTPKERDRSSREPPKRELYDVSDRNKLRQQEPGTYIRPGCCETETGKKVCRGNLPPFIRWSAKFILASELLGSTLISGRMYF